MFLSGCVIISGQRNKKVYEQGYRKGMQQEIKQAEGKFQGGNFPFYHWATPIVQEVKVPAHLSHGAMIPEHNELVIIKPGEWVISPAYPIESSEE
jgi:hypothetical protein